MKGIIAKGLANCGENEADQTLYIQFVRNSGRPEFIPQLLYFAEKSKHPLVHHGAVTSLGVFDRKHLGDDVSVAREAGVNKQSCLKNLKLPLVWF